MKIGYHLFASIFQAVVGLAAIVSYILLAAGNEPVGKWTVTLILAIVFLIMGATGIVSHIRRKK
jgi:uncharacterized membrane protein HdeD (DUF308 family)